MLDAGEFPYTRGIHESMYRGKLWTMRQFAGFARRRDQCAIPVFAEQGQTGLLRSVRPADLMGYDADHPTGAGRGRQVRCGGFIAGRHGDAVRRDSARARTVSKTINAPASISVAMYLVVAEKQGVIGRRFSGTLQNDILKEYIAQKE